MSTGARFHVAEVGWAGVFLNVNGSHVAGNQSDASFIRDLAATTVIYLSAGDVVRSYVFQDSAGILIADARNHLSLVRVSGNAGAVSATQNIRLNSFYLSGDGDSEGLAVDSAGKVGIGTASPSYTLHVAGDINTTTCFRIGATTVSGTCASDGRLKENIRDYTQGLSDLLNVRLHTYTFNGLGEMPKTGEVAVGVIAQELEKTNPELVKTRLVKMRPGDKGKTDIKVVDYSKFSYMLINAVKELYQKWFDDHEELQKLKLENAAIKQENAAIRNYLCSKDPSAGFCE